MSGPKLLALLAALQIATVISMMLIMISENNAAHHNNIPHQPLKIYNDIGPSWPPPKKVWRLWS